MITILRAASLAILGLAISIGTVAAEDWDYFAVEGTTYDSQFPRPEDYFGHGLGDQPVRHDRMVAYLRLLAEQSDRLTVETIGYSHEGRPILFLVATAPENHARLEAIRTAHLARIDPNDNTEADQDMPVITWLNYGVHGAESAGMDAAIPTVYHLASGQGEDIDRLLGGSVILITAIFNPDGHSRRINWVNTYLSDVPVTDPAHIQHNLWIEARTNHYWFDLNRQWLLLTQPEPQAWIEKWHHWKPNVSVDYHEMGSNSTYYFHPGVPTRLNPLVPDRERELLVELAGFHAAWLDSEDRLYFTEEGFDNFYIGKGSTYPSINGSVGVLFEVGAARGGAIEAPLGMRRYADNIRTHFRTSLTSATGALAMRADLQAFQRGFFRNAMELAQADNTKAYVFTSADRARLFHFIELLHRHRVSVYSLAEDVTVDGRNYAAGQSFIVPLEQAQYRMIRGLFDRLTEFEENVFYDVSGWTLPLAYDLDYGALEGRRFDTDQLGTEMEPQFPAQPAPDPAAYGYLFSWDGYYAPRALHRLLDAGVIVRASMEPVTVLTGTGPVDLERGAVFVPLSNQKTPEDEIHEIMRVIAREDGIRIHGATSGRTPSIGVDLGGRGSFTTFAKPKALMVFDDGIRRYDAGEIWHLMDHRMKIPLVMRKMDSLAELDLTDYTHLIIPHGEDLAMDEAVVQRVHEWVRMGGTVVAIGNAAKWAQDALLVEDPALTEVRPGSENAAIQDAGAEDDDASDTSAEEDIERRDYATFQIREAEHIIGGAIFGADLDITHPIGFGYRDRAIALHRNTELILQESKNPYGTVAQYIEDPLLTGYASEKRRSEIGGTPAIIAERRGRGSVILFADNPNFRGTFYGTNKLFLNSLFFSTAFNAPRE